MLKKVLLAALLLGCTVSPVLAEGEENPWTDIANGTAGRGDQRHTSFQTGSASAYNGVYDMHAPGDRSVDRNGSGPWAQQGSSQSTGTQLANSLGTRMGGPMIIGGRNTFIAPSNLAYQVEHNRPIGGQLPKVTLDSFVHKAKQNGMADLIYGDEGTHGPPPYSFFMTIQSGGVKATTGHPSDAPSAWY